MDNLNIPFLFPLPEINYITEEKCCFPAKGYTPTATNQAKMMSWSNQGMIGNSNVNNMDEMALQ